MTANQISFYKAKNEKEHYARSDALTQAHYERSDLENKRHNFATEALNAQDLSIKDWANRANVELGFTNAEINRAHYEKSDYNNQVSNQLKTDQLVLDAISTLGSPKQDYYLSETGQRIEREGDSSLILGDYYNPELTRYTFGTEPLSLDYLTPAGLSNLGKFLSGAGSAAGNIAKTVSTVHNLK